MVHGRNLIVQTAGGAIVAAKSCDIETQADIFEVSSTSLSNFKNFESGRKEWSISTNHLLTNLGALRDVLSVGSLVTMHCFVADPSKIIYFKETISGFPVQDRTTSTITPDHIYFHLTNKYFVAEENGTFYQYWVNMSGYSTPPTGAIYKPLVGDGFYSWAGSGNSLAPCLPRLQGQAIVKRCHISGQIGSLAKGAFVFQGKGDLSWVTSST